MHGTIPIAAFECNVRGCASDGAWLHIGHPFIQLHRRSIPPPSSPNLHLTLGWRFEVHSVFSGFAPCTYGGGSWSRAGAGGKRTFGGGDGPHEERLGPNLPPHSCALRREACREGPWTQRTGEGWQAGVGTWNPSSGGGLCRVLGDNSAKWRHAYRPFLSFFNVGVTAIPPPRSGKDHEFRGALGRQARTTNQEHVRRGQVNFVVESIACSCPGYGGCGGDDLLIRR